MNAALKARNLLAKLSAIVLSDLASLLPIRNEVEVMGLVCLGRRTSEFEMRLELKDIV